MCEMANAFCRLCLSEENLLDVFSKVLFNSEQLRRYIWLCCGVNILATDAITKYVCQSCCDISIKIYKFRKNAMANDMSLKNLFHQSHNKAVGDPTLSSILTLNEFVVKKPDFKIQMESDNAIANVPPTSKEDKQYIIHPSIFKVMKHYPKTVLPSEVITMNCDPRVFIVNSDIAKSKLKDVHINVPNDINMTLNKDAGQNNEDELVQKRKGTQTESQQKENPNLSETQVPEKVRSSRTWFPEVDKVVCQASGSIKRSLPIEEGNCTKKIKVISITAIPSTSKLFTNPINVNDASESTVCIPPESSNICDTTIPNMITDENLSTNTTSQVKTAEETQVEQNQSGLEEESPGSVANKRKSLHRKRRSSFFIDDVDIYDSNDPDYLPDYTEENCNLLESIDEEETYACNICNKFFDRERTLKCHRQRVHKSCIVCNKIFRSLSSLISHMKDVCHKTIIENQPILCLKRCDDMVKRELNITSDSNFDVFYISDDDEERKTDQDPQQMTSAEHQHLSALYQRYHSSVPSFHKTVACQEDVDMYTITMGKGQATLSGMYQVLKYCRIPINLESGDSMKVKINRELEELPPVSKISDWASCSIKRIKSEMIPKPNTSTAQSAKSANQLLKKTLEKRVRSTASPSTSSPIILNALNTFPQLRSPSLLDNHIQIQVSNQNITPVVHTANNQIRPQINQTTTEISSNQHTQLVNSLGTHTIIPQTHTLATNLTNPATVSVRQIPVIASLTNQAIIRTPNGYILSSNPSFTAANFQSVPTNFNPAILTSINKTLPNQSVTFTSANQAMLRPLKRSNLPTPNVTVVPNHLTAQAAPHINVLRPILPNASVISAVQKKTIPKNNTDQNLVTPDNTRVNMKPVSVNNATSNYIESTPSKPDGKSSYLRVKAPWELK